MLPGPKRKPVPLRSPPQIDMKRRGPGHRHPLETRSRDSQRVMQGAGRWGVMGGWQMRQEDDRVEGQDRGCPKVGEGGHPTKVRPRAELVCRKRRHPANALVSTPVSFVPPQRGRIAVHPCRGPCPRSVSSPTRVQTMWCTLPRGHHGNTPPAPYAI